MGAKRGGVMTPNAVRMGSVILLAMAALLIAGPAAGATDGAGPKTLPAHRPEQITSETEPVLSMGASRDGGRIVYAAGGAGNIDLWARSLKPGDLTLPRQLTFDPSEERSPAFSPDGSSIAFTGTGYDVKGDIYLLDLTVVSAGPRRITGRETEDGGPCFSPDGATLYFHQLGQGESRRKLAALDLIQTAARPRLLDVGRDAAFPAVSPDGRRIAFVSFQDDPGGDIFILNLDAGRATALTRGPALDFLPAWSADGKRVLFSRVDLDTNKDGVVNAGDNPSIHAVAADGAAPTPFPLTSARHPAFAPKAVGSTLYFLSDRGGVTNVWSLPAEGEIPAAPSAEDQLRLAGEIAGKIPYDPYLTLLAYSKVREVFPGNPEATARADYDIGRIFLGLQAPDRADAAFSRAVEGASPWAGLARIERVMIRARRDADAAYKASDKSDIIYNAVSELAAVGQGRPARVDARAKIASARLLTEHLGDSAAVGRAIDLLDQVISTHGDLRDAAAEAMVRKADAYSMLGRTGAVYPAYAAVIDAYPDVREWADRAVARILDISMADLAAAGADEKIRSLRRIALENQKSRPILAAAALNRIGDLLYATDKWADAKRAYRQALEQFTDQTTQSAAARLSLAEIYYREDRFRQALDLYEKEISVRPYEDRIYRLARQGYIRKSVASAEHLFRLGEVYAARKIFKELMDYDDAIVEAHRGYIKCGVALGELDAVLTGYKDRMAQRPDDAVAVYGAALAMTYREDAASLEAAETLLRRAVYLDGGVEYYYQTLGYVLEVLETVHGRDGNLESALEAYKKAYFLNDRVNNADNAANLLLNMGNIYYLLAQYGKALESYSRRMDAGKPFENPDTEILFYRRVGLCAFQVKESRRAVSACEKTLHLIDGHMDARAPSADFDKMIRFIKDRVIAPALKADKLKGKAEALSRSLSEINIRLADLTRDARQPPSSEWEAYKSGVESLLAEQEKINRRAAALTEDMTPPDPSPDQVRKTLTAMMVRTRKTLQFPERLTVLKTEMLDRYGLALQEDGSWEKAMPVFEQVYELNEKLGFHKNLARNKRSAAYSAYRRSETLSGAERRDMLQYAKNAFSEMQLLIEEYGVPDPEKSGEKKGGALIGVTTRISLDEPAATQAARGFTADQERRIAQAFLYRIALETGDLAPAEKAIAEQLAEYPPDRPVSDKDVYGVSLLLHQAGQLTFARKDYDSSFAYFKRSADLCLRMRNPVSSAVNTANMAKTLAVLAKSGAKPSGLRERLNAADVRTSSLLRKRAGVLGTTAAPAYHNAMGVWTLASIPPQLNSAESAAQCVKRMTALQQAGGHFTEGVRMIDGVGARLNRREAALLATLHLNMANVCKALGEPTHAATHLETARLLSRNALLPDLEWRALAGLGLFENALKTLEKVTILRAGCGPGEITRVFSDRVADLVAKNQAEAAFNLAERLAELERFHRLAPLMGSLDAAEKDLYAEIYPRLTRIRDLRWEKSGAEGEDLHYLEQQLAQESALVGKKTGENGERLSDLVRGIADEDVRERVMMLYGLAARAETLADREVRIETGDWKPEARSAGVQEEYKRLIQEYQEIRAQAASDRRTDAPAGALSMFGPAPVEAVDVMESLPEDGTFVSIFGASRGLMVFTVTPDDISAAPVAAYDAIRIPASGTVYAACDDPLKLPAALKKGPTVSAALSGSHFVRSIRSRKPFKRRLLTSAALPITFDAYEVHTLSDMAEDAFSQALQGVHTLLLRRNVSLLSSVPVREGQSPDRFAGVAAADGRRIRMERIFSEASNLSLALLEDMSPDAVYAVAHMASLFGCPSLIAPEGNAEDGGMATAFLQAYPETTAAAALDKAETAQTGQNQGDSWLLMGFQGMSPDEAEVFAEKHFVRYVKNGQAAYKSGAAAEALTLFENAILIAQEAAKFSKYLPNLYQFSREAAFRAGMPEKALHYAEALADLMEQHQPDTAAHADALLRQGLLRARLEQYDAAARNIEEAAGILAALEMGSAEASALADLGVVLENATDYDNALNRFMAAASLSEKLGKDELLARQFENIGRINDLRLSRYAMAIKNYKNALEIYQNLEDAAGAIRSLINIGRCYRLLGNFIQADQFYADAEDAVENMEGGQPAAQAELRAKVVIEQANNAWFQGKYQDAFTSQRAAYEIARRENLPLMRIISLNTAGLIWWTLGNQEKALFELNNALAEARDFKTREDEISSTLNNIGLVYRETERYEDALEAFDQALAIDERIKSRWAVAYDLRNKGLTYLKMDKPLEAIPLFEKARDEAHAIGNRINEAKALLGLAQACLAAEKNDAAEAAFSGALSLSEDMSLRETQWRALFGLARLRLSSDPDQAEKLLFKAVGVIEGMRADIRIEQLRDSFIDNKMRVYETLVRLLADQDKINLAFETAERSRARNFIDLLGTQRLSLNRAVDQQMYERQAQLRSRIEEQEALLAQSADPDARAVYEKTLQDLNNAYQNLMLDIQAQNPQLASLITVDPLTVDALLPMIEKGTVLLAYYVLDTEIFCWIVRPDGLKLVRTAGGGETLGRGILEYRRMIQNLEPLDARSAELYRLLLAPVLPDIGPAERIGLIPHGPLHYLSFAALADDAGFLIDRYPLFYLPSASLLQFTLDRRFKEKNLKVLAIGNPDLGDPVFDLPFAEYEVGSIRWNFQDITLLTRELATENWVAANIGKFGVIHLASHGEFDPVNPLFSAVKLARGEEEDGDLEAAEVFGLSINADMVVLSACQTGLGKVTAGDDVIGLNRSFFYAGTHTVVSSLWRVSDISTAILIKHFYRRYADETKAESLRSAMLHVKNLYPHPGYWGAFTLVGDYF